MLIRVVTDISFNPTKEYDAMMKFEADNDMSEWTKKECTVFTMYRNIRNSMVELKGGDAK